MNNTQITHHQRRFAFLPLVFSNCSLPAIFFHRKLRSTLLYIFRLFSSNDRAKITKSPSRYLRRVSNHSLFSNLHQNRYDTASRFPIVPADLQAVHTLPLAGVPDILRSDPGEVLRASRQAERTSSNCFARRERCGFPGERRDRRLETAPDTAMIYSRRF